MDPEDILVEMEKLSSKDEISKEDIMDMLQRYAATISVYDLMLASAYMRKDGEYIHASYREKYLEIYIKNFIMRMKEVLDNNDYDNSTIDKKAFDELGQLKSGKKLYDEQSPFGKLMQSMMNVDANSYDDAHSIAVQTVVSGYINSGCQIINTAANATNAVTGARVGNSVIQKNTPVAPTVIQGFGR